MDDPSAPQPRHRRRPGAPGGAADPAASVDDPAVADDDPESADHPAPGPVDLAGLSVAGITRRRVGWVSGVLVAVWIVIVFARQVGDAQAATNRATQLAADNAALSTEVDALQSELDLVVQSDYVGLEARAHRMGSDREIPFTLDPTVPAPVDGAPGSASVRLGATVDHQTPLESWLSLLFGPTS